ncbi:MAG: acyltransferase [Proteobacteria bacterium]|nr:acyltransferase [Pseudomonadota bacterium]
MDTASRQRLFFADWLRIIAFALLVLYHVGMVYVPWPYHVKHDPVYPALEPLMRLTNPWRMSLLFVVSGLATGLMLGRPRLARQRTSRLMLPLAFGMLVIVPPQAWLQVRDQFGYAGSYLEFMRLFLSGYGGFCQGRKCLILPTWNHLWFLPYLWVYTLVLLAAWRWLPRAALRRAADRLAAAPALAWLLLPIAVLGLLRALLLPRFGETHALLDDVWAHATYGPMFAFGVLLARRTALFDGLQALRWPALVLAVAAWATLAAAWGVGNEGLGDGSRWALRWVFAAEQWGAIVAAFGFARLHLNVDHRWRRPLNEAVFPLYIVHQTIIVGAAVALRPLGLPAGVEAALIVALTFAGGLAAWRLVRGVPALRPWMGLNTAAPPRPAPV